MTAALAVGSIKYPWEQPQAKNFFHDDVILKARGGSLLDFIVQSLSYLCRTKAQTVYLSPVLFNISLAHATAQPMMMLTGMIREIILSSPPFMNK
jgi:hypothetical protein